MKDSFIIKTSYLQPIEMLNFEQRGRLLTALIMYESGSAIEDVSKEMDAVTAMAFSFIRSDLDKNAVKYAEVCEKRKEAGRSGGRPKQEEKQMVSEETKEKQKKQMLFSKPDNDSDSDSDYVKETTPKGVVKKSRFAPPTPEEVSEYCKEKNYTSVDAERFVAFYESKGWMVGKNKMTDWKAAVRNWNRSERPEKSTKPTGQEQAALKNRFNNFQQREYDYAALERQLLGR